MDLTKGTNLVLKSKQHSICFAGDKAEMDPVLIPKFPVMALIFNLDIPVGNSHQLVIAADRIPCKLTSKPNYKRPSYNCRIDILKLPEIPLSNCNR